MDKIMHNTRDNSATYLIWLHKLSCYTYHIAAHLQTHSTHTHDTHTLHVHRNDATQWTQFGSKWHTSV